MGLFFVSAAALLLPAFFVLVSYLLFLVRPAQDTELTARRRWRMINRANVLWLLTVVMGLVVIAEVPLFGEGRAVKAACSIVFIIATYLPFMTVLGIVDRKIRGIHYSLRGFIRFQYAFFFCRLSAVLLVTALLYVPVSIVDASGAVSYRGIGIAAIGAVLFIVTALFQMRLVGRAAGILTAPDPNGEPAATVAKLAERAGVGEVRLLIMETFGYPFYNAFAAPGKAVYITRPLLEALAPDEVAAIAAHEIGHLITMKKRTALVLAFYAGCVVALWFLVDRAKAIVSDLGSFVFEIAAVLLVFLAAVAVFGRISRRFETAADGTAAELVGGTEKVVGALEKIYALGMIPRRFDKKGSENASHPSLERRVAELRGEPLPAPKGRRRRIVLLVAAVALLGAAALLHFGGGERINPGDYQYSWVDVTGPLEAALADDPDNFELLKRLAVEYFYLEEDNSALEYAERALAEVNDPGLQMLKGMLLSFSGDGTRALSALEEARRGNGSTLALKWAAVIADGAGDGDRARGYVDEIAAVSPDDPFVGEMRARIDGSAAPRPILSYSLAFQGKKTAPAN